MTLGSRLDAVTKLISEKENNTLFADVGSDHAFLAIEVIKRGLATKAIASDINEMPLLKGKENASRASLPIEFILSDGFDSFDDYPVTSAAICGMGGELIAKIVLRSKIAKNALLVLQPMSAQEDLRRILWDNGFEILKEIFVTESGKPYTVMQVVFSGKATKYDYIDLYLGKERSESEDFADYCKKILIAAEKRRLGIIARGESTTDVDSLIKYCQTQTISFSGQ